MRVGSDFQAEIPELIKSPAFDGSLTKTWASIVWLPNSTGLDAKVDFFIDYAMSKYNYCQEQALGLLFWHHHNIDKALSDLPCFMPSPDEWATEDRVLFEQAFTFLGKNFNRIHNMLPEKSMGSLVKYYYSWKKRKNNVSSMDRHANKANSQDFLNNDKNTENEQSRRSDYWMCSKWSHARTKSSFDLHLNADELFMLACGQGDQMFKMLDNELSTSRKKVGTNKQIITNMKRRCLTGVEKFRVPELSRPMTNKWTNSELLLAVQGIRQYGCNYQAISEVIGTKSEHLVRNFFINYKTRYNLDDVLKEYEKEMKIKSEHKSRVHSMLPMDTSTLHPSPLHQQPPHQQLSTDHTNSTTNKCLPPVLYNQTYRQIRDHGNQGNQQQPPPILKHVNKQS